MIYTILTTEHKIKDSIPTSNIEIAGYHEFIFNPTQTSHGGTGFYVKDNLAAKKRDDLLLKSPGPGEFESTFLEIVFPNQKNDVFTGTLLVLLM